MTVKIDFLISPAYQVPPMTTSTRDGCRQTKVSVRVPSSWARRYRRCVEHEGLGLHVLELLVGGVDEERLREQRVPRALSDHAHGDAVRGIGAGERVDDVDVPFAEACRDLLAETLEVLLRHLCVDVAPPDPRRGARLAHDELVLG
jgi:hypothetical protein